MLDPSDAEKAVEHLSPLIQQCTPQLDPQADIWLAPLKAASDDPADLRIAALNADPQLLTVLRNSLQAALSSTAYRPGRVRLGTLNLPAHNALVGSRLRPLYQAGDLRQLCEGLEQKGVFRVRADPYTGLIRTANVDENAEMGARQWVTDTVRAGDIAREKLPEAWRKSMWTLVRFYEQPEERAAFKRIIAHPQIYREGGPIEGVAHIFDPHTLKRDPTWFNNKRLESHGLALGALVDTILGGLAHAQPWGFQPEDLPHAHLNSLAQVLAHLAQYFIAIDYPTAPSAGPWEEIQLPGGLTWDTEAMRSGLEKLNDLLHNPAYSGVQEICALRQLVAQHAQTGPALDAQHLDVAVAAGLARVIERVTEGPTPIENPDRPYDASSSFIAASSIHLAEKLTDDVAQHYRILESMQQHLVRDNGIIRYAPFEMTLKDGSRHLSPDSYLAKNYWIAFDKANHLNLDWYKRAKKFGSMDTSQPDVFAARAQLSTPHTEAQWFMVSDIARGYGHQVHRLLDALQRESRLPTPRERALIDEGLEKTADYLNRSLLRITGAQADGTQWSKSDGLPCPRFSVPEAYECVSTLEDSTAYVPGTDTPLAWAAASLRGALRQHQDNLNAYACFLK